MEVLDPEEPLEKCRLGDRPDRADPLCYVQPATRSTAMEDQDQVIAAGLESHEVEPTDDEELVAGGGNWSG